MVGIRLLSTGYFHARGVGPCEWAQWPVGEELADEHFFPEASGAFRRELRGAIERGALDGLAIIGASLAGGGPQ